MISTSELKKGRYGFGERTGTANYSEKLADIFPPQPRKADGLCGLGKSSGCYFAALISEISERCTGL
jgi:hypothetical protein